MSEPQPPVVYFPAPVPPGSITMTHRGPSGPVVTAQITSVPCGSPAFTCQGSCQANGVGGIPAVRGEYPWLVQLYSGGRYFCSGSIIDNYNILTSASCIEP